MNRALRILYGHITAGVLLVSAACGESVVGPVFELDPEVEAFVAQLTAHRASVGCAPLTWNWSVAEVALGHSLDMVQRDFFDHVNPDGATPFDRLRTAGVEFSSSAENIAYGYPTGTAVLTAWLNSPGHRDNIENCVLTEHGVGVEGTHWTHLFINP